MTRFFDEPMSDTVSLGASPRWGASTTSWSADRRTRFVTRTVATALASDSRIQIELDITPGSIDWLHPPTFLAQPTRGSAARLQLLVPGRAPGRSAPRHRPAEPAGVHALLVPGGGWHVLGAYTFTFTIGDGDAVLHAVPADPAQGFSWPYYLGIPPALSPYASLLVEPNNTGAVSNDLAVHDRAAEALGAGLANYAVGPRALLDGFSASGAFAHRFTALHPELVQAVAAGSGAGWPLAPVAEWDGIPLRYPVGIADLAALVGAPFAATSYRRVPLFVYVGDADENDPVPGWDPVDRDAVFALTGVTSGPIWPRWPVSQEIHEGAAMSAAEFAIYPGVGHAFSSAMQRDVQDFFVAAMPEPNAVLGGAAALGVLAWLAVRARIGRYAA